MASYTIPTEIKSKIWLKKNVSLEDAAFIALYNIFFLYLRELVHPSLVIPYVIFNIAVPILLTRRSYANPGKQIFMSIVLYFARDKRVYHHAAKGKGGADEKTK